jgi:hypothetical protein
MCCHTMPIFVSNCIHWFANIGFFFYPRDGTRRHAWRRSMVKRVAQFWVVKRARLPSRCAQGWPAASQCIQCCEEFSQSSQQEARGEIQGLLLASPVRQRLSKVKHGKELSITLCLRVRLRVRLTVRLGVTIPFAERDTHGKHAVHNTFLQCVCTMLLLCRVVPRWVGIEVVCGMPLCYGAVEGVQRFSFCQGGSKVRGVCVCSLKYT